MAVDAAAKVVTVIDDQGNTEKVTVDKLDSKEKKYPAKPGNPTELITQGDGSTVAIKENKEEGYVGAVLSVGLPGTPAGTKVQIKALDYTSKSDDELIDIILPNKRLASVKKSDVKLFEAGVYNSETDINNNPKTDENTPDNVTGKMDDFLFHVESAIGQLQELKSMIEETSSISADSIKTCIAELTTYRNNLEKEKNLSKAASPAE